MWLWKLRHQLKTIKPKTEFNGSYEKTMFVIFYKKIEVLSKSVTGINVEQNVFEKVIEHSKAARYFRFCFWIFSKKNLKYGPLFSNDAGSRHLLLISLSCEVSETFLQFLKKVWTAVFEQIICLWMYFVLSMLSGLNTAQKMKFSIKDFFSKFDQIHSFLRFGLRIWSHLLTKLSMENFIFCAVSLLFWEFFSEKFCFPERPWKISLWPIIGNVFY